LTLNIQKSKKLEINILEEELLRKIESITKSLRKQYFKNSLLHLLKRNIENTSIICNYIISEQTEINIKDSTKESKIKILVWLSNHFQDKKSFKDMTKEDVLDYLNNRRKSFLEDPSQRWIGSYNGRQIILNKFFRWLYNPDESDHKKRETPHCMNGIKKLSRKELTHYKPSDLWEPRESAVFLKYCPSIRDRCYHAMAIDMSARPHEILNLKIKDIVFKVTGEGKQYAEVVIKGGKTRPRTIPLIDSLPYVKDLINNNHPSAGNSDSWLFVSNSNTTFGSKLTYDGLTYQYKYFYKTRYFPKLLEDETVLEPDKSLIRNMLTKPWNLYVFRHSSLTEKSQILKEHILRDHAGWTMSSKMPQIYIHYFGTESSKSLLEVKGIINRKDDIEKSVDILKPRNCPNCNEPNKADSRFCFKCKMVLTFDSYQETLKREKEKESEMQIMKRQIAMLTESQKEIIECLKYPERLAQILNDR
jgi:integrase